MQCDQPDLFPAARHRRDTLPLYSHLIGNQSVDSAGPPLPLRRHQAQRPRPRERIDGAGGFQHHQDHRQLLRLKRRAQEGS